MTSVRAVTGRRDDVKVERVEDTKAARVAPVNDPAELDAERRAEQAMSVQRDWQPDLRGVTVHDDVVSREAADSIGAAAYTQGRDIHLGSAYHDVAGTPQGDHVLAHELAHVEQGHRDGEIHRYPATALTQGPVDWASLTANVEKPGEGLAGGVYILTSNMQDAPIPTAVAKPVFNAVTNDESGEQLKAGDDAMRMMGINAPVSRVVKKGTKEWTQLVALAETKAPKQPGPGEDPMKLWHPMKDAKSFVVMGEVPGGQSVKSMAVEGGQGGQKLQDLKSAILSEKFLGDLGKMCIVDYLVGNFDRLIAGKSNLGNVMVSVMNGKAEPWAIDTTAMFGKAESKSVLSGGTASKALMGNWQATPKKELDAGSAQTLKYFIDAIIGNLEKHGVPPQDGALSPKDDFTQTWTTGKGTFEGWFNDGWTKGLQEIKALYESTEGRDKLKSLTTDAQGTEGGKNLDPETLEMNAQYLTARQGSNDDEAKARAAIAGRMAIKNVTSLNLQDLQIPVDAFDELSAPLPPSGAYTAEVEQPYGLESTGTDMWMDVWKKPSTDVDTAKMNDYATQAFKAKNSLQSNLGTKTRGLKKKEQPRNRVLAGSFAADAYYLGPGAWRVVAITKRYEQALIELEMAAGVADTPQIAGSMLPVARFIKSQRNVFERRLTAFHAATTATEKGLGKLKVAKKDADWRNNVRGSMNGTATSLKREAIDGAFKRSDAIKVDDLIARLEAAMKPKPQEVQGGGSGRRPMIGSRGR